MDYASHALSLWNKATDEEREEALRLGKGSHSTMTTDTQNRGDSVLAYSQATKGENQIFDFFAVKSEKALSRTITQMEALKLSENQQIQSSTDLGNHHDQVAEIVKGTLYPQAAQKPLILNVGARKKLINFFDLAIPFLELDDPIRLEANELHGKTLVHALLDGGVALTNQIVARHAKQLMESGQALAELIKSDKLGLLLDTENQGLKRFELMLSLGIVEKE